VVEVHVVESLPGKVVEVAFHVGSFLQELQPAKF